MDYKPRKETCSTPGCQRLRRPGQRTCHACHSAYMKAFRSSHVTVSVSAARAMLRAGTKAIGKLGAKVLPAESQ